MQHISSLTLLLAACALPTFAQADARVVTLDEPASLPVVGGAGRYLIFHLPHARRLDVVDVVKGAVVQQIPRVPSDVLFAAGVDQLVLFRPNSRVLERWPLGVDSEGAGTVARSAQRTVVVPGTGLVAGLHLGSGGSGPLLISGKPPALYELETLAPIAVEGELIGHASKDHPAAVGVSADGQSFVAIRKGLGPVHWKRMRVLEAATVHTEQFSSTSQNYRLARPTADGSMILAPGPRLWGDDLEELSRSDLRGQLCLPSSDPRYFLAVRFCELSGWDVAGIEFRSTSDARILHQYFGMSEMAPSGNTRSRSRANSILGRGAYRFHWFVAGNVLATFGHDDRTLVIRAFDLETAMVTPFPEVASVLPESVSPGEVFSHQLEIVAAESVHCVLLNGPQGMTVSPAGLVRWPVADDREEAARVAIEISARCGNALLFSFELGITPRGADPVISAFSVSPASLPTGQTVTASYTIANSGDSELVRAELWRSTDLHGAPNADAWQLVGQRSHSGNGRTTSSLSDIPASTGIYWYGLHVANSGGNWGKEPAIKSVRVD